MRLTREVRFVLRTPDRGEPIYNSWAGWPASLNALPYVLLRITVQGAVNSRTGYLCNIAEIDQRVRDRVLPRLCRLSVAHAAPPSLAALLRAAWDELAVEPDPRIRLAAVEIRPSPFLGLRLEAGAPSMIYLTQSFEFAAAHVLSCPDLDADGNRALFGKCANPNGHGHNYVVEVTLRGEADRRTGSFIALGRFEALVKEHVIDAFDHKHLNLDCAEFRDLNPTVENIAKVVFERLVDRFDPEVLSAVRVYETPKTWAEVVA